MLEEYFEGKNFEEVNNALAGRHGGDDRAMDFDEAIEEIQRLRGEMSSEVKNIADLSMDVLDAMEEVAEEYRYYYGEKPANMGKHQEKAWRGVYKIGDKTWAIISQTVSSGSGMTVNTRAGVEFTHDKEKKLRKMKRGFLEEKTPPHER